MANVHTISNQESASQLNDSDLFFISQSQNPYNSAWKSRKIDAKTIGEGIEQQFRDDNFSEELGDLQEIYERYLNSGNLTINYDSDKNKIQLLSAGSIFSEFDSSEFVTASILDGAQLSSDSKGEKYLVLKFTLSTGKTKSVAIPLNDLVDVYYSGNGLCCENKTFRIDTNVVSTVDHKHVSSDITDLSDVLKNYERIENLKSAAYTLSSAYSLSNHEHDGRYYTESEVDNLISDMVESKDLRSAAYTLSSAYSLLDHNHDKRYLSTSALDEVSVNWQGAWSRVSSATNGLSGDVGSVAYKNSLSTSDIEGYEDTTYSAGDNTLSLDTNNQFKVNTNVIASQTWISGQKFTTYSTVSSNLSNDGYALKTIFRDWISAS